MHVCRLQETAYTCLLFLLANNFTIEREHSEEGSRLEVMFFLTILLQFSKYLLFYFHIWFFLTLMLLIFNTLEKVLKIIIFLENPVSNSSSGSKLIF